MVTNNYFGEKRRVITNPKFHLHHSASQIESPLDVTFVTKEEVL